MRIKPGVDDLDFHNDRPFLVMEYIHGRNLEDYARDEPVTPRRAAELVAKLAGALAMVHRRGIIHRDIKPRNILIDEAGQPRLIDFGLARLRHAWSEDPSATTWGGTLAYMAPEQARLEHDRIGPRSDVFGLGGGALLPPDRPGASTRVPGRIWAAPGRRARRSGLSAPVNPRVPRRLERICLKAMAQDPERRYRTAGELGRAMRRFRRRPWMVAVGAAILGLAALAFFIAPAAPSMAPRVVSLEVRHFRGEPPTALGTIGKTPGPILFDDDVRVFAQLNTPAYCYLIALNPDGSVQLCHPDTETGPPPRSDQIVYPIDSKYFPLTDGTGFQGFVVLASRQPLPSFARWKGRPGCTGKPSRPMEPACGASTAAASSPWPATGGANREAMPAHPALPGGLRGPPEGPGD